jgi:hypothetical protein
MWRCGFVTSRVKRGGGVRRERQQRRPNLPIDHDKEFPPKLAPTAIGMAVDRVNGQDIGIVRFVQQNVSFQQVLTATHWRSFCDDLLKLLAGEELPPVAEERASGLVVAGLGDLAGLGQAGAGIRAGGERG